MAFNQIEDPTLTNGKAYQMMEVKHINLSGNKIKEIAQFYGFP